EKKGPCSLNVQLTADPVVLVLNIEGAGKCREDFIFSVGRRRKHELHGPEHAQRDLLELIAFGEDGGFADVAENHVGTAYGVERPVESLGDGLLDGVFLEADAKIARDDFDDVLGFGRIESAEEVEDEGKLVGGAGEFDEFGKLCMDRVGTE